MIRATIFLFGAFWSSTAIAGECDAVLGSGTMSRTVLETNDYARTVYAARIAQMTYQQASSDTSLTAVLPIKGIPLKAGFSESEFNEFKSSVNSSVNVDQTLAHQESLVQSVGDATIINAWTSCMSQRGGLSVQIAPRGDDKATVAIKWWPTAGSEGRSPIIREVNHEGADLIAGRQWTVPETSLGVGVQRIIDLKRPLGGDILFTVSTDFGDETAYLPRLYKAPPVVEARVTVGSCAGRGGVSGVHFWGPPTQPCNGIASWGQFAEEQQTLTSIGSCKGHGGVEGVTLYGPVEAICAGIPAWGKYEGRLSVSEGLGFCLGRGNVIGSMTLWGPKGLSCGGLNEWGTYN